ncbi:hypothetical protein V315_00102 [Staphylococcus aureus F12915]|nr:hypothetical protein V315_00102 [Staphylococcus aureus F12915]
MTFNQCHVAFFNIKPSLTVSSTISKLRVKSFGSTPTLKRVSFDLEIVEETVNDGLMLKKATYHWYNTINETMNIFHRLINCIIKRHTF